MSRAVRGLLLPLTVIAVVLAGRATATVETQEVQDTVQEKPICVPVKQYERPVLVDSCVDIVEIIPNEVPEVLPDIIEEPEIIPEEIKEYTEEQHEILSIIIYQEAGGDMCSDDTRRKVGSVFLNRVNSSLFPNTFEEVALGKRQYGTLYITGIKWPDRAVLEGEQNAVQRAKDIAEELLINGSVLPENVIWQAEFEQGNGVYCYQDKIYFCY